MNITSFIERVYGYISRKWKIIVTITLLIFLFFILIGFFLWVGITYYILKWFRRNIDDNLYHSDYTSKCKKYMMQYGDLPIKNIYVVKQPVSKFTIFLLNLSTFYNYDKEVELYVKKNNGTPFIASHIYMVVEVELPNKFRKHIKIEKTDSINITLNYKKDEIQEMIKINCKKNKHTINKILRTTEKRVKSMKYFNWHLCKNNCHNFTQELLKSITKKNERYLYLMQHDFFEKFNITDLSLHMVNCIINSYSILQEFLY
tara:strand:- start:15936 stop:16712 length:777 start_codon:yes stop_codon:yes gene_type:complete